MEGGVINDEDGEGQEAGGCEAAVGAEEAWWPCVKVYYYERGLGNTWGDQRHRGVLEVNGRAAVVRNYNGEMTDTAMLSERRVGELYSMAKGGMTEIHMTRVKLREDGTLLWDKDKENDEDMEGGD